MDSVTICRRPLFWEFGIVIELNFPNAVRERRDLFGRAAELGLAAQALHSRARQPIVILGERLAGKTSLQQVIAHELKDNPRREFTPLFPPPAYTLPMYAAEILDSLRAHLEVLRTGEESFLYKERGGNPAVTQAEFLAIYRNLLNSLSQTTIVLCFDEFDSLLLKCTDTEKTAILDFTLSLVERSDLPLILLFTMTNPTEQSRSVYPFRFLSKAFPIQLNPLDESHTEELVSTLLAPIFTVTFEAQADLFRLAGGHPYFVKLILQGVLDSFPTKITPTELTTLAVQKGLAHALDSVEARFFLSNILEEHFTERERAALKWLAAHAGPISVQTESYAEPLYNLVQREYLQSENGLISFRLGFLREWLRGNQHLYSMSQLDSMPSQPMPSAKPELVIDDDQHSVYLGEREVDVTQQEFLFLSCLAARMGKRVDRETVAQAVWSKEKYQQGFSDDRIYQLITRLRKKIGDSAEQPTYIEARSKHYKLHHARYKPGTTP